MFFFNCCIFESERSDLKREQTERYLVSSVDAIVFNVLLFCIVSGWSFGSYSGNIMLYSVTLGD